MYTYVPDQEENHLLVTLVEGVRMTDQQLQKVFGANKIVKVHTHFFLKYSCILFSTQSCAGTARRAAPCLCL